MSLSQIETNLRHNIERIEGIVGARMDVENWEPFEERLQEDSGSELNSGSDDEIIIPDATRLYNQIDNCIEYFKNTKCYGHEKAFRNTKQTFLIILMLNDFQIKYLILKFIRNFIWVQESIREPF